MRQIRQSHPSLKILGRAFDRGHLYALREAGADLVVSETYYSALYLAENALRALGSHPLEAQKRAAVFDVAEAQGRDALYETWLAKPDGERYGGDFQTLYMELEEALQDLMHKEPTEHHLDSDAGWTPPRPYTDELDRTENS